MKAVIFSLALFLTLVGIGYPDCMCTLVYEPVCASNGVTYGNEQCMACENSHLTVASYGPCPEEDSGDR